MSVLKCFRLIKWWPAYKSNRKKMIQKSSKICWLIRKQMALQLFYYKLIFLLKTFWQKMEHNISFLTKTTSKRMIKMLLTAMTENPWSNFIVRFWQFKFDVGTWKQIWMWQNESQGERTCKTTFGSKKLLKKSFCFTIKKLFLIIKLAK